MKFSKLSKFLNGLEYEVLSAALLLSYAAVAAIVIFPLYWKTPIQMYNAEVFLLMFFMPASIFSSIYFLLSGFIKKEPISKPVYRWCVSTVLALSFVMFWPSFTALKSAIPRITPFYFDQYLASFDRWIHFGVDPWRIVHFLGLFEQSAVFDFVYFRAWLFATTIMLLYIIYFDQDSRRRARYLFLYVFTWILLGNILAVIFSSAGPIYVERLTGDPAFRDLTSSLIASGYGDSSFFAIQNRLWGDFSAGKQQLGSGISAFPSVHVGIASVVALYLSERSKWLIAPGAGFVVLILAGSVFCGWHYAVDGYVSIVIVILMHRGLRRLFDMPFWGQLAPSPAHAGIATVSRSL